MSTARIWLLIAAGVLGGWLIYLLQPVLAPFLVAALFAYLGDPVVDRLEPKLGRTPAVVVVFVITVTILLAALLLLVPLLEQQITAFIRRLPEHLEWLQRRILPVLRSLFGVERQDLFDAAHLREVLAAHWREAGGIAAVVVSTLSRSGMTLVNWGVNMVLIPVVLFYLLRDWDLLVARVRELLPRGIEPTVSGLARESDEVLGAFLRGQLTVMVSLGAIYSIGLAIVGVDLSLLLGMLAGLVSFVPYLGFILGVLSSGIAAVVQFQDWSALVWVFAVFGFGQLVESFVLTPWLVGDRVGLHPVAVIFAILAGGQLFGFTGVLLALPVAAVIMVWVRHLHEHYLASDFYGADDA